VLGDAAVTLSLLPVLRSGYDPQAGAEKTLAGDSAGKRKASLETVQQQLELFDGLPVDVQPELEALGIRCIGRLEELVPGLAALAPV